MHGVQFFFSCISSVCSNAKEAKGPSGEQHDVEEEEKSYPAIGYFIVYRETETCSENLLFAALHNQDMEPAIRPIKTRARKSTNDIMEKAARQLFLVLKDHNNSMVQEIVDISNAFCYEHAAQTTSAEDDDTHFTTEPTHFPTTPCRLVVVNQHEFNEKLYTATEMLQSDGLLVEIDSTTNVNLRPPCFSAPNAVALTMKKIERVMKLCHHALYRSDIYAKPPNARITYVKMMDAKSYLHKLLTNQTIQEDVLKHFQVLERLLCHPACEMIEQIKFDLDLIEVSNGYCLAISSKTFIECPITECQRGKLSPRAFVPYDCSTPPEPLYFREGTF